MGRIGTFVTGMATGAALLAGATHYHLVRGKEGVFVVRKVQNNLADIYVDTRDFTVEDWMNHRMLAVAIMQAEKGEVFDDSSLKTFRGTVQELANGLLKSASTQSGK
jgi:hypothetical protein